MHDSAAKPSRTGQEATTRNNVSTVKYGARMVFTALLGLAGCMASDAPEQSPAARVLRLVVDTPEPVPAPLPVQAMHVVPDAVAPTLTTRTPQADTSRFEEVFWTAHEPRSVTQLESEWGLKFGTLAALNPDLRAGATLPGGTKLRVFKLDPEDPPRSIGTPNRGKLRNGVPLPEGDAWRLRPVRRRAFGTHTAVGALVDAFEAYGERFPDGPKIRVGELAKRTGGRVSPHASHRSGRDVDIGYIFRGDDDGADRWRVMHERNFDAEKNWVLIQEILKSNHVQTIYVSKKLQKLLHKEAKKTLSEAELAAIFEYPSTPESPRAKLQHWKGHGNHMHVRFECEPGNRRCRARGR